MQEKTVSTMNELLNFVKDCGNNKLYFRGENRDYGETSCVPSYLRNCAKLNISNFGERKNEWFKVKLEGLGVGFPYIPPRDNSTGAIITSVIVNLDSWRFLSWGEEQLEALMQHYAPDLEALKNYSKSPLMETALERYGASFYSSYMDITSDIVVALHFACSEYRFFFEGNGQTSKPEETTEDGFLFVFDPKEIEKTRFLKLVYYPSYSYFYKNGDKHYYQPFDRITHQRGAFLAPKRNEEGIIYDELKQEIKNSIRTKVVIKHSVKKELYEIFGGTNGLEYYFPKIPCTFKNGNEIQQAYKDLKGTTVFAGRTRTNQ